MPLQIGQKLSMISGTGLLSRTQVVTYKGDDLGFSIMEYDTIHRTFKEGIMVLEETRKGEIRAPINYVKSLALTV